MDFNLNRMIHQSSDLFGRSKNTIGSDLLPRISRMRNDSLDFASRGQLYVVLLNVCQAM